MKKLLIASWLFIVFAVSANAASLFNPSKKVEAPVEVQEPVTTPTPVQPEERIALYWENTTEPHPERAVWSDVLIAGLKEYKTTFDIAAHEFCPKYATLNNAQQLKALGEFSVALAYYESGFNPKSNSVDVGTKGDKGSWSVGLYQLSANDNSAKKFGMTFEKLQEPTLNIMVYIEQMQKQVKLRKKFFLDNSDSMRYWAVALYNNRYSKIPEIKTRVLKHAPFCK